MQQLVNLISSIEFSTWVSFGSFFVAALAFLVSWRNWVASSRLSDRERWQAYNVLAVSSPTVIAAINKMGGKDLSEVDHTIVYLGMMKLNNLRILFEHNRISDGKKGEQYVLSQFANETIGARQIFEQECFPLFEDGDLKSKLKLFWDQREAKGKPLELPNLSA